MALYGALAKDKHLSELGEPLETGAGVLSPATRRQTALRNLLGDDSITPAQVSNVANPATRVQELTASGAVTAGVQSVELDNDSASIAATIADAADHPGLFIVKQTGGGTAGHTLTLTAGTFDGTNNVATLDAVNEALVVYFDSAGNGTIVENVGAVALS